jgi:hypothetical protein
MKTKSLMLAAALFFAIPANAATVLVDISAQDGFRSFGSHKPGLHLSTR